MDAYIIKHIIDFKQDASPLDALVCRSWRAAVGMHEWNEHNLIYFVRVEYNAAIIASIARRLRSASSNLINYACVGIVTYSTDIRADRTNHRKMYPLLENTDVLRHIYQHYAQCLPIKYIKRAICAFGPEPFNTLKNSYRLNYVLDNGVTPLLEYIVDSGINFDAVVTRLAIRNSTLNIGVVKLLVERGGMDINCCNSMMLTRAIETGNGEVFGYVLGHRHAQVNVLAHMILSQRLGWLSELIAHPNFDPSSWNNNVHDAESEFVTCKLILHPRAKPVAAAVAILSGGSHTRCIAAAIGVLRSAARIRKNRMEIG